MNELWVYSLGSLLDGILHLTALVLSLVYWKRYPTVCILVMAGSLLNLVGMGGRIVLPGIWFRHGQDRMTYAIINLGVSLVNLSGGSSVDITPARKRTTDYTDSTDKKKTRGNLDALRSTSVSYFPSVLSV